MLDIKLAGILKPLGPEKTVFDRAPKLVFGDAREAGGFG